MNLFTGILYRGIVKPILFRFPADEVHEWFLAAGRWLGRFAPARWVLRKMWAYERASLSQTVCGLRVPNPIGLSAGFDYNADLAVLLPSLGFGFHTAGTLTALPYGGNPPPMLDRLPRSKSLLVNKGFKNAGLENVLPGLPSSRPIPFGVSIGATNRPYASFDEMVADLVSGFRLAEKCDRFDYYELNISCPNLLNLRDLPEQLSDPSGLEKGLRALLPLGISRPVFIKMPLEKTEAETAALLAVAERYGFIRGLIFSNLVKDRSNPAFDPQEIARAGKGNFSGKPTEAQSNALIRFAYRKHRSRFVIIGSGGVFSAEDAYRKIRAGASLVQLITGMVYRGPQEIGLIVRGLAELCAKDGLSNIGEAVGKDA